MVGTVDMSQVLQHGFQGEVRLYSEKVTDHVAVVTLGSLTSTAVVESHSHLAEGEVPLSDWCLQCPVSVSCDTLHSVQRRR